MMLSTIPSVDQLAHVEQISLETLLNNIDEAVILINQSGQIYYLNLPAESITDLTLAKAQYQPIDQILPLYQDNKRLASLSWLTIATPEHQLAWLGLIQTDAVIPIQYAVISMVGDKNVAVGKMVIMHDQRPMEELTRLKSEFVSVVSHQLRTPASAVKWYLETLLENRHGNPLNHWQEERMQQAFQSNERMIHLINDLLNASRLDSGRFVLKPIPTDISAIVNEVSTELLHFATANNVAITNAIPATTPPVLADGDKVREVITNLLTNAIKYTQPGHHTVTIDAQLQEGKVEFSVADQGMGIPEKDMEQIFQKFYRADNAVESQTEGSGLGLYIAREIIRLHGGDIWLTSTTGVGTTVFFSLPLSTQSNVESK